MAFGLNRAELIGRLGADVTINHLVSGGRVANLSIATDESYIDKQSGERVNRTEWHRVVTFQPGLVDMFENLKRWALGTFHGLRRAHLRRYLDEFVFRCNRPRRHTATAFDTLLGIGARLRPAGYRDIVEQRA